MQTVKIQTPLSEEEFLRIARELEPRFKALPGLLQKYNIKHPEVDFVGGVYIWDSMESMQKFRITELAASIPKAYKANRTTTETAEILFELRD